MIWIDLRFEADTPDRVRLMQIVEQARQLPFVPDRNCGAVAGMGR